MSIKISELPEASSIGNNDIIPIVQNETTKGIKFENFIGKQIKELNLQIAQYYYFDDNFMPNDFSVKLTEGIYHITGNYDLHLAISYADNVYNYVTIYRGSYLIVYPTVVESSGMIGVSANHYKYLIITQGTKTSSSGGYKDDIVHLYAGYSIARRGLFSNSYTNVTTEVENDANKVTTIDENSTDTQYPSAKAVYNELEKLRAEDEALLDQIPTKIVNGETINIQDSAGFNIKNFKFKGSKNLLLNTMESQTINGLTITVNADKSILINGTTNATTSIYFASNVPLLKGVDYILSTHKTGTVSNNVYLNVQDETFTNKVSLNFKNASNASINLDTDTNANVRFYASSGITITNLLFYPMIEQGTTETSYEPYGVTGDVTFNIENENLYDVRNVNSKSTGIDYDENDWLTVEYDNSQGTSTKNFNYFTKNLNLKENHTYTIVCEIKECTYANSNLQVISQYYTTPSQGQFTAWTLNSVTNGIYITTKESLPYSNWKYNGSYNSGIRSYFSVVAGDSGKIKFRLSVIDSTTITEENFVYKPYTHKTQLLSLGNMVLTPTDEIQKYNNEWCLNTTPIEDTTLTGQLDNVLEMVTYRHKNNFSTTLANTNGVPNLEIEYQQSIDVSKPNSNGIVENFWNGTQAEYDAIENKVPTTLYLIDEE